jgi:hypothetical protein
MASQIRFELTTSCPQLQDGLQARIHDPLWMLARQWQFGEFRGEDVGSPVAVQVAIESAPLDRYKPGPLAGSNAVVPYSPLALALETAVEAEQVVVEQKANWKLAADAGLQLNRLLIAEGVGQHRSHFLKSKYALKPPTVEQRKAIDSDSLRFLLVTGKRVVDGVQLYGQLASLRSRNALTDFFLETPFDTVPADDRAAMLKAIRAWLNWYDNLFQQVTGSPAWIPERIEYEFSVAAKTSDGEVVLAAPEYLEGNLDWFSFVAHKGKSLGTNGDISKATMSFLPAPVTFRGMPSARFWEFEDAKVNLAQVDASPHDLARILLVKFALEYSNDWFLVPLEIAVGSICQIHSLIVTNTFGERMLIPHTSKVDGADSPWRMFSLTNDTQQMFFLPPVLGPSLQSAPIEEVLFLRDEMANVAWGVERVVESASGQPLDRFQEFQEGHGRKERAQGSSNDNKQAIAETAYRLGTSVPDYWIPLLPVQDGTAMRLRRGALPDQESSGISGVLGPRGLILEPQRELLLNDEEVPREGARVTRAYQYARWSDGSTHLWVGRRKQPGRGEGSSGLRFDIVEPIVA